MTDRIGAIGGYDPFLIEALKSPNINFRGTSHIAQNDATSVYNPYTAYSSVPRSEGTSQQIAQLSAEEESSGTGMLIAGALATAVATGACIYAHKKGNGNIIEGFKNIFNGLKAKGAKAQSVTTQLTAVRNKDGSIKFLVPDKKTTIAGKDKAEKFAQTHGIDLAKLLKMKDGETVLQSGVFKLDGNTITFSEGKVTKIVNSSGRDITAKLLGDTAQLSEKDAEFLGRIDDFIANAADTTRKNWAKGLSKMTVVRTVGDDTLKVVYERGKGKTPQIVDLTTLERFDANSDVVRNYLYNHPELQEVFNSKDFVSGKIFKGTKIEKAEVPFDNKVFKFENGEVVGYTEGGVFYPKGSEKYGSYMLENEENVSEMYKKLISGKKIPKNVSLQLVAA